MDTPPPIPPQQQPPFISPGAMNSEKILAALCHASPLFGLPLIFPLIVFLVKNDEPGYARQQAVEALNFHLTCFLASLVASLLIIVAVGLLLLSVIGIAVVILAIVALIKVLDGKPYVYPFNLRLVK